ncbi:MAG TPA: response regulator [Gemmatimonadales bacterium]
MKRAALRVLIVEDSTPDVDLLLRELRRAGYEPEHERVDTAETMNAALDRGPWDLVVSDYSMPGFSGTAALALLRARALDAPFIFVSGTIGEDIAVSAMRAGAQDYVLKGNLARLGPAVERELREVRIRRERHEVQEALLRSEARFQDLFDNAPVALYRTTPTGAIVDANPALVALLGYPSREALLGQRAPDHYVDPEERRQWAERLDRFGTAVDFEVRLRRHDGAEILVENTGRVVRDADGGVGYYEGSLVDITERRRAEHDLRAAQERLQQIVRASVAVIYALEVKGAELGIRWVSENVTTVLGWTPAETESAGWWTGQVHPDDRERVTAWGAVLQRGVLVQEYRLRHKDGSYRWVLDQKRLLPDPGGGLGDVVGAWLDITDKKSLEIQLQQAQKMEAIGRLAGGVAHDFNNILTAIFGYADTLAEEFAEGSTARADLDEIRNAAERAAGLTRQLLAFSRQQTLQPVVLNLNALVQDLEKMLRRVVGEDVEIHLSPAPGLGNVRADPGQLQQVAMNLVVNARDAMPTGGKLLIETQNADLSPQYAELHQPVEPGPYVMLAVTDTGVGIDPQTRARIFEPFFSTKERAKGTGLGLSTVYGIVKQSGGYVWVYSEVGKGTAFKVYLPRVDAPADAAARAAEPGENLTGTETILLAEDDVTLRRLTRTILEKLGYSVLAGAHAAEALELAQVHAGEIHLLVTDVVMPGASGRELARRLAATRPDAKVLYVSGYTDEAIVRHGMLEPGLQFLQKPFTPSALARRVREVLSAD